MSHAQKIMVCYPKLKLEGVGHHKKNVDDGAASLALPSPRKNKCHSNIMAIKAEKQSNEFQKKYLG